MYIRTCAKANKYTNTVEKLLAAVWCRDKDIIVKPTMANKIDWSVCYLRLDPIQGQTGTKLNLIA